MSSLFWRQRAVRAVWVCVAAAGISTAAGCVGGHALQTRRGESIDRIAWYTPAASRDTAVLENWRASVGPPVFAEHRASQVQPVDTLTLVSWNTALGAGDVERLVGDLRRASPTGPIVLLLQEVYRAGDEVPVLLRSGAAVASRLRGLRTDGRRDEIEVTAAALGMNAYYVPSMRNGSPVVSDEDRGNAILSTLPLTDLAALELPFERQRRVAVGATIRGPSGHGDPWHLRVVSAHLDNISGARRLWVASEFGRVRQTRGLIRQLEGDTPLVLGGDFNTWFGFSDRAFRETARAFPGTRVMDRRATFRGLLRLDHLFYRVPDAWRVTWHRAEDAYGSDHHPLIATIDLP